MERYDLRLIRGTRPAFDELPAANTRRVFGVDYAWVRGLQRGEIFFTRQGWSIAESLLPEHWFDEQQYWRLGRALDGATGAVYHVPVPHPARTRFGLVVKFCRFAQDLGITALGDGEQFGWPQSLINNADFLDPFREFANLQKLRRVTRGRVRTKHPLAIYCPSALYSAWQLGRNLGRRRGLDDLLAADQAQVNDRPRVQLDWERVYVLVYQWIDGIDLEQACRQGMLREDEMTALTRKVAGELVRHGFAVLDHKPRHIIIRPDGYGERLRHRGNVAWAIVDYELLVPLVEEQPAKPPLDAVKQMESATL